MLNTEKTPYAFLGVLLFLITSVGLIVLLNQLTNANNATVTEYYDDAKQEVMITEPSQIEPITTELSNQEDSVSQLTEALKKFNPDDPTNLDEIIDATKINYQDNYLDAQDEIVAAIHANNLDEEELGYLFLPNYPAESQHLSDIPQINIPLYLQKDAKWRKTSYGSNTTKELGENGCAIVSLAMIQATLDQETVTPEDILNWSKERYYVHNEGTSWQIFHDFALEHQYAFENYGDDFNSAMEAVRAGKPVIVSVKPGFFTEVGHILVIRGYQDGKVYVNDPNDDPEKMFSIQGIDENILLSEANNYWAFSKGGD